MKEIINHGEGQRFQYVTRPDSYQEAIVDSKNDINLFFLPVGGHGTASSTVLLAKHVVDFLNENHSFDVLYPQKK